MAAGKELSTKLVLRAQADSSVSKAFSAISKHADTTISKLSKIGNVAKKSFKVAGVAAAAVGTAVVGVAKSAIDSYAEYEQLVGGVETLFKDNAGSLMKYADEAYKTAGLSANTYMSTITSFSAAMINSLGGDTAKATEYSNQAVIDMSDNANKMGTDMESIMNTYQSLSRGQYGMLDNLKLGYGGTKTEMERLLQDAEKLTGIKYDISNFGDVTQAIHAIQDKMGITGTTAKEASSTISGSINALKGSWANLLTGIANEDADFGALIDNFVNSALAAADNLLPRIQTAITGIAKMATGLLQKIVPKIIEILPPMIQETLPMLVSATNSLIKGILQALPSLISTINTLIPDIISQLVADLPGLLDLGIKVINTLINGISAAIPSLLAMLPGLITTLVTVLTNNIGSIIDTGTTLLISLIDGIMGALPLLIDQIPTIIAKLVSAIITNLPKLIEMGIKVINSLINGLIKATPSLLAMMPKLIIQLVKELVAGFPKLVENGKNMLKSFTDGIKARISAVMDAGKNIVKGLWNGIKNAKDWLVGKIKSFASGITDAIKKALGINSPSVVMEKLAKWVPIGFGNGITDNAKYAVNAVKSMGGRITKAASRITPAFSGGLQKFGTGGTVTSPQAAIVGDKPETIVPHGNTARNRALLAEAAKGVGASGGGNILNFTFAPIINGGNAEDNRAMLHDEEEAFERRMQAWLEKNRRLAFDV